MLSVQTWSKTGKTEVSSAQTSILVLCLSVDLCGPGSLARLSSDFCVEIQAHCSTSREIQLVKYVLFYHLKLLLKSVYSICAFLFYVGMMVNAFYQTLSTSELWPCIHLRGHDRGEVNHHTVPTHRRKSQRHYPNHGRPLAAWWVLWCYDQRHQSCRTLEAVERDIHWSAVCPFVSTYDVVEEKGDRLVGIVWNSKGADDWRSYRLVEGHGKKCQVMFLSFVKATMQEPRLRLAQ